MEVLFVNLSLTLQFPPPLRQEPSFPPAGLHDWLISARLLHYKSSSCVTSRFSFVLAGFTVNECRQKSLELLLLHLGHSQNIDNISSRPSQA